MCPGPYSSLCNGSHTPFSVSLVVVLLRDVRGPWAHHAPSAPSSADGLRGSRKAPRRQALLEESAQTPRGAVHIAQTRAWLLVAQQPCPVGAASSAFASRPRAPSQCSSVHQREEQSPQAEARFVQSRTEVATNSCRHPDGSNPQAGHLPARFGVTGTDVGRPDAHNTWEEAGVGEACVKGTSC